MQHDSMVSMLHDKSNAGPKLTVKDAIPKPKIYQTYSDHMVSFKRPDYVGMARNMQTTKQVIESLGGIQDTIAPMQESLLKNELRPIEYIRNYA